MTQRMKQMIETILKPSGVKLNGKKPWDLKVNNYRLYSMVLMQGSLGLGEAYMDGWWDCRNIDQFADKVLSAEVNRQVGGIKLAMNKAKNSILNMQTKDRSQKVAKEHYDLGNEFYKDMLDKNMQYTCAYWKGAKTLEQAQKNKLKLVCEKLELKKGDKVLELGCGWGGFARYAAKHYGCSVTGYNISTEQVKFAREWCKGLPVKIVKGDYRTAKGKFDKIASIGLCEHIGYMNYPELMELAHKRLKAEGLFLLHTIGNRKSVNTTDAWIEKYIFPNSMLPSVKQLSEAAEPYFVTEDLHSFGSDYDKTLMAWYANFKKNWKKHSKQYGERFYRMWSYYLLMCAGSFRARQNQLWQIVYSKGGRKETYKARR